LSSPYTFSVSPTANTTYTLTTANDATCTCTVSGSALITVNLQITPAFTQIGPLCQNSVATPLPSASTNGINGTWNPATISTATAGTTTYTFTPAAGQCAVPVTINIIVTAQITPAFTQIGPLCLNAPAPLLPVASTNGINGTWNPATINTATAGTTTYTFTPDADHCAKVVTMDIVINQPQTATLSGGGTICAGSSRTLTMTFTGAAPYNFTYTDGRTSITINGITTATYQFTVSPVVTTTYTVTSFGDGNCTGTASNLQALVAVVQVLQPVRYPDVVALPNVPVQLTVRNLGNGYKYVWNPPVGLNNYTVYNPVFNYNNETKYTIAITSDAGCTVVDTLLVKIKPDETLIVKADILVPKAWSPNGDGHNDKLITFTINIRELKYFRIFNRWGQMVFQTNVIGQGWDGVFNGKPQVLDTYTWIAEGVAVDGQIIKRAGSSVLIR